MAKFTYFAVDAHNAVKLDQTNFKEAKAVAKDRNADLFRAGKDGDMVCVWINKNLIIE